MRFDPSALSLLLVALLGGAAPLSEARSRPWGLLPAASRRPLPLPPVSRPSTGAWVDRAAIVPRGGESSAAADVTEVPPPPPPPVSSEAELSSLSSSAAAASSTTEVEEDEDLEDIDARVKRAMRKLGLTDDDGGEAAALEEGGGDAGVECKDGVCELPPPSSSSAAPAPPAPPALAVAKETDPHSLADRLSSARSVPRQVVLAAIGASGYSGTEEGEEIDVEAVENILEAERELMSGVPEDCDEVKLLTSEGHSVYLTRRALAFADMSVDDARAILVADAEDEEEERRAYEAAQKEAEEELKKRKAEADRAERKRAESEMKTVNVAADFDPTAVGTGAGGKADGSAAAAMGLQGLMGAQKSSGGTTSQGGAPKPAKKEDVVFEIAEESQIQSLIIESPVPVLLDVYADWCGPCKMLTPALEQMATKAGGLFRLVKLNTDDHRSVSQAMEVQALPTVFGIKDGRVLNSFQGMPRDEDALRNFMMGLLGAGPFDPPLSDADEKKHADLSIKLLKVAGASSFPFSARERLQGTTKARLDDLVKERDGNMALGGESASTVRSLLSNVVQNPFEPKFRRVNLDNRVIKARVAAFPQCVSILKSVGFVPDDEGDGGNALVLAKGKKAVNLAPLVVARDAIDKWIDRNRYNIAAAARKRNDELERAKLAEETARLQAEAEDEDEYDSEEEEDVADPDACAIKVRLEGKKKVHELSMNAEDSLSDLVDALPGAKVEEGEEVRITCAAKRLIVKSTDAVAMGKSLREHGLAPAAAVVIKIGGGGSKSSSGEENGNEGEGGGGSKLAERAAARRSRKRGSQTMQSVGIYSKDDNAKGELIDGGGGVWYEHDVTSDDEEAEDDAAASGKEEEGEEEAEEEGEESDEASDQDEESS